MTQNPASNKSMKTIIYILATALTVCWFASCTKDEPQPAPARPDGSTPVPGGNTPGTNPVSTMINIRIGDKIFTATLADTPAAKAFGALLPLTITMTELNGNEKYHNLADDLPASSSRPGTIRCGDLMLYGTDCVVLFYETFASPYSYTRIATVTSPEGLADALGSGNPRVSFEQHE